MNRIEEILGNKKYIGSVTQDLNSRLLLEQPDKIRYENTLFNDVSQQKQYYTEKTNGDKFRLYGKINSIMSLDVFLKTVNGIDTKVELSYKDFAMNLNNWSVVVLKSKQLIGMDSAHNQIRIKGVKQITKTDGAGNITFNLSLKEGLPAKTYFDRVNQTNACLQFPLGHNFNVDDKVYITSHNNAITSGIYNVLDVVGDRIYINAKAFSNYARAINTANVQTASLAVASDTLTKTTTQQALNAKLDSQLAVRNITMKLDDIQLLNQPRPKIAPFIEGEFQVRKIVEKEQLEYYIKVLEVVDVIDEVDNCAFSINNFNESVKSFFLNHDFNTGQYVNNLGEPLSEIYIGIIKNGSPDATTYGNVESHFEKVIDFVNDGDGLEQLTTSRVLGKRVKKGEQFYHSVCEYSTEQLTETEISYIHHRFIHKNVLFNYNPFYMKPIRLKSTYIEHGDNVLNLPSYAVFSRLDQKYIWRDLLDIGVSDENGNMIDFPFMNGSFYVYNDINFFVRSEKNATRKYILNKNDVTGVAGDNQIMKEVNDILDQMNLEQTQNPDDPRGIKPYYQYTDKKC